jgi:hypothetical protein
MQSFNLSFRASLTGEESAFCQETTDSSRDDPPHSEMTMVEYDFKLAHYENSRFISVPQA